MSRYIPLDNCHFVVDYDAQGTSLDVALVRLIFSYHNIIMLFCLGEGNVILKKSEWITVASYPFLESSRSPNAMLRFVCWSLL